MMQINRNNYEVWFLDYYEGRLSKDEVAKLMEFLELHYDLKEEFDYFENVTLPPARKIVFDAKESLKKKSVIPVGLINELNYAEFFVGEVEGDLTKEQSELLSAFIEKNPFLKKEFDLFLKTKITPDRSIEFTGKESLKKSVIIPFGNINENNYTELFIAASEGDASLALLSDLKEFLALNPGLNKEYNLFKASKITPDTSIIFDRKEQLKHATGTRKLFSPVKLYYALSIAASIILILAVYFLLPKEAANTFYTASRNDVNMKRESRSNTQATAIIQSSNNNQEIAMSNPLQKQINFGNHHDDGIVSRIQSLPEKTISGNNDNPEKLSEITVYGDFYNMMMKKKLQAGEQKQDNNKVLSLKELALFKLKKAIAPEDKKHDVTPDNSKITVWDIADAGLNEISNLTGINTKLDHKKDNSGYTLALGNNFEMSRSKVTNK